MACARRLLIRVGCGRALETSLTINEPWMRLGCSVASGCGRTQACFRLDSVFLKRACFGALSSFGGLLPRLDARLRASCAAALAILCGVSSRVAEPLQYEPSHTRLLAITEEFKFHPGLPGWNFSVPNAGWGMRVRNAQLGAPYEGNPLPGRIMLGAFAWTLLDRGASNLGTALGEAASVAALPPGRAVLCLGCLGYLGSTAFASGRRARRNRYTTKRN